MPKISIGRSIWWQQPSIDGAEWRLFKIERLCNRFSQIDPPVSVCGGVHLVADPLSTEAESISWTLRSFSIFHWPREFIHNERIFRMLPLRVSRFVLLELFERNVRFSRPGMYKHFRQYLAFCRYLPIWPAQLDGFSAKFENVVVAKWFERRFVV